MWRGKIIESNHLWHLRCLFVSSLLHFSMFYRKLRPGTTSCDEILSRTERWKNGQKREKFIRTEKIEITEKFCSGVSLLTTTRRQHRTKFTFGSAFSPTNFSSLFIGKCVAFGCCERRLRFTPPLEFHVQ